MVLFIEKVKSFGSCLVVYVVGKELFIIFCLINRYLWMDEYFLWYIFVIFDGSLCEI